MYKKTILLFAVISFSLNALTQKDSIRLRMTLERAIEIANKQSIYSFRQKNMYLASYWDFRSYKASKLPSLSLSTTPFSYENAITKGYDYDDEGNRTPIYTLSEELTSYSTLNLTQNIPLTGATVRAYSRFSMDNDMTADDLTYRSTPISIQISQPLNGYNAFKWEAKIEPLKFEQAKREYLQSLQELAIRTNSAFFNLVEAQINLSIAETNVSNADTLYRIGQGRFEIGTVTQDELLDLELSYLNSTIDLSKAKVNLHQARSSLNSFLGFDDNVFIECVLPSKIPSLKVKVEEAMGLAYENNPDLLNYEQQLIEADRDIASARSQYGMSVEADANVGYNKESEEFKKIYKPKFNEMQDISLTLNIPIVDWGRKRGKVQMAKSEREVAMATIRQAKIDFDQNIFLQVMEFNMQEKQVQIAAKADTIAKRGYEVTKQRFLIDKVDVLKLNSARNSLDNAKRNYIQSVQDYWENYFTIRRLTLYDFEKKESLITELDYLLQK